MFTGIIEEVGSVENFTQKANISLTLKAKEIISGLKLGDSVAVNGVCLTVTRIKPLTFDIMAATWKDSALALLKKNDLVNLERAATLETRLGGHLVSGHVDCVGKLAKIEKKPNLYLLTISFPVEFRKFVVPKGSVAINGISLTIQSVQKNTFTVGIIPHTLANTDLAKKTAPVKVNLEFDMLAKYVDNILQNNTQTKSKRLRKYLW